MTEYGESTSKITNVTHIKRRNISRLLKYQKRQALIKQVKDNKNNTKSFFNMVSRITDSKAVNPLPPDKNPEEVTEKFAIFFLEKIEKIHNKFKQYQHTN